MTETKNPPTSPTTVLPELIWLANFFFPKAFPKKNAPASLRKVQETASTTRQKTDVFGSMAKRAVIQSTLPARDISQQHPVGKHPAEIYKRQKGHAEVLQAVAEILFAKLEYY